MTLYQIHLSTDATYKLIWQGIPVILVGSSDNYMSFHQFGLAVTKRVKALLLFSLA